MRLRCSRCDELFQVRRLNLMLQDVLKGFLERLLLLLLYSAWFYHVFSLFIACYRRFTLFGLAFRCLFDQLLRFP